MDRGPSAQQAIRIWAFQPGPANPQNCQIPRHFFQYHTCYEKIQIAKLSIIMQWIMSFEFLSHFNIVYKLSSKMGRVERLVQNKCSLNKSRKNIRSVGHLYTKLPQAFSFFPKKKSKKINNGLMRLIRIRLLN